MRVEERVKEGGEMGLSAGYCNDSKHVVIGSPFYSASA